MDDEGIEKSASFDHTGNIAPSLGQQALANLAAEGGRASIFGEATGKRLSITSLVTSDDSDEGIAETVRGYRRTGLCLLGGFFTMAASAELPRANLHALEMDLGIGPEALGFLLLAQEIMSAGVAPVWGHLCDSQKMSRKRLWIIGNVSASLATILIGYERAHYFFRILLRVLHGMSIACALPITQSYIAEIMDPDHRGRSFGLVNFAACLGRGTVNIIACITGTEVQVFDITMKGWRASYYLIGCCGLLLSFVMMLVMDPAKGYFSREAREDHPRDSEASSGSFNVTMQDLSRLRKYMRISTFKVLIVQSSFGNGSLSAMSLFTIYLQYVGFRVSEVLFLYAVLELSSGFGGLVGGYLGDILAMRYPEHGRPMLAQFSTALCVILGFTMLWDVYAYPWLYAVLLVGIGVFHAWDRIGTKRPVLTEIVRVRDASSILAYQELLQEGSGAIFGAPFCAILAQVFGYQAAKIEIHDMDEKLKQGNTLAMRKAMLCCTVCPWFVGFCCYCCLHRTYKKDVVKLSAWLKRSSSQLCLSIGPQFNLDTIIDGRPKEHKCDQKEECIELADMHVAAERSSPQQT